MEILEDIGIRYAGIFFFYIKEKRNRTNHYKNNKNHHCF